jgi:UDP-glucuronate 4-epimerase
LLAGKKILITGGSGQVARPVAEALAPANDVWCLGRFSSSGMQDALMARQIRTWRWDMAEGRPDGLKGLPDDFTHVMHAAVYRGDGTDYDATVEINCVATGHLMTHCRNAEAFLFVSSGGVYTGKPRDHRYAEADPLGGQTPWLPTYPIGKIAAEGAARSFAAALQLPTVIARLNVAYGPYGHGGVPMILFKRLLAGEPVEIPLEGEIWCNPIHTDDIARQVPLLWRAARVPALVINWGGDEIVTIRDILTYLADSYGVRTNFLPSELPRETQAFDNTLRRALIGDCKTRWQDGLMRTVRAHFPDLAKTCSFT